MFGRQYKSVYLMLQLLSALAAVISALALCIAANRGIRLTP